MLVRNSTSRNWIVVKAALHFSAMRQSVLRIFRVRSRSCSVLAWIIALSPDSINENIEQTKNISRYRRRGRDLDGTRERLPSPRGCDFEFYKVTKKYLLIIRERRWTHVKQQTARTFSCKVMCVKTEQCKKKKTKTKKETNYSNAMSRVTLRVLRAILR